MGKGSLLMNLCVGRSNLISPDAFSLITPPQDPDQQLSFCLGFVGFDRYIVGSIRSAVS